MARPRARGRPAASKAPMQRGSRLRPGPMQGAVARRGSSGPQAWSTAAKAPLQRGGRLRPGPLQGATACGGSSRPRARPTTASPQRATPRGKAAGG
ncbi:hypothetical protein GW17_00039218, partial [Ensete ventricosum]